METKRQANVAARIGQVAQETGLSVDAIRFYEKQGLLASPARTEGGFRVFGEGEITALKLIQNAQGLGFSLEEIRELLLLQRDRVTACEHVQQLLEQKIAQVRRKILELQALEKGLNRSLRECKRNLRQGAKEHEACPVLQELNRTRRRKGVPS
jgi:DNA-binding transcriptional MerR regulator